MERVILQFDDFDLAINFHRHLFEILRKQNVIYCSDLYNLLTEKQQKEYEELNNDKFKDYGWNDLNCCQIEPYYNGECFITMPRIIKIKKEKEIEQ